MSFTLHVINTANITSVAAISRFSKEANFITSPPLPPRNQHSWFGNSAVACRREKTRKLSRNKKPAGLRNQRAETSKAGRVTSATCWAGWASRRSEPNCNLGQRARPGRKSQPLFAFSGSLIGTCSELLTTRVLPSGWLSLRRSASRTRKNFSESIVASMQWL